jgi:hypothetical protein
MTLLVRVPVWFSGYEYSIYAHRAVSGWKNYFRMFRDVNEETDFIHQCIFGGTLEDIRGHLESNPGCVYDRLNGLTGADVCNITYRPHPDLIFAVGTDGQSP